MRNRLNLTVVQQECGFHQRFAVAGGTGTDDFGTGGQLFIDILDRTDGGLQRTAVVVGIKRVQQRAVFSNEGRLCRRGTRIDTQIAVTGIGLERRGFDAVAVMTFAEGVIFFLGGKQRIHTFYFKFHLDAGGKLADHFLHRVKDVFFCI